MVNANTAAAPGELSDQPLSLVTSTKPNLLLMLDDSGSMDFQTVVTREAQLLHGDTIDGVGGSNRSAIQNNGQLWQLCAGYNALAFNPEVKYEKWPDFNGNIFDDNQSDNIGGTVLANPLDTTGTIDLSDNIYIRWDDDDNDGLYDFTPTSTPTSGPNGSDEAGSGECGPGVAFYDAGNGTTYAMPETGNTTVGDSIGILTDSNAFNGTRYNVGEDGSFTIDLSGSTTGGTFTFEVSLFNVDRSDRDPDDSDENRADTDSLTVYGGLDPSSPVANAITVTQLFDGSGGEINVPSTGTYTTPNSPAANAISSSLELNDSSDSNRANEIQRFTVTGNQVTLVFDGGINPFTRVGFSISWVHSSFSGAAGGDGILTKADCRGTTDSRSHCVVVEDLPLTEADALANPATASLPYNTQENYANWFTYYRSRDFVAKKALGDLVFDSDYRLGFTTINDNGDGGVIIKDVENNADNSITQVKSDLLEKIYRARTATSKSTSNTGTPLVRGLSNAGRYFTEGVNPESDFLGTTTTSGAIGFSHNDGDTVATNSPVLNNANGGQCQQNFTLLFSDGAWNDDIDDYANTSHDINGAASGFAGNIDSISTGDDDGSGDGDGDLSGGIYADGVSDSLADIAMYYFINDLAPSATDSLSLNLHGDTITHQHMVTFSIGFGVNGTLDRNPNIGADPADTGLWPSTGSAAFLSDIHKIDDLRHAGFNSRGDYLSAANVQELEQSLDEIISEIGIRLDNTAAGASFSAFELAAGEFRYDTTYNNVIWWGELEAFAFDPSLNNAQGGFSDTVSWSADTLMRERGDNRHIASDPQGRKIITYNGDLGIPFAFPNSYQDAIAGTEANALSAVQVSDLLARAPHVLTVDGSPDNSSTGNINRNQTYGEVIVDYLRGSSAFDNASLDGQTVDGVAFDSAVDGSSLHLFRDREQHYIGALIHSQPRFVAGPSNDYPDSIEPSAPYSDFANDEVHSARREMLYVGANDGMLHGFFATDESDLVEDGGQEVFAYIPRLVSDADQGGQGLSRLAIEGFDGAPYVDGSPIVADVYVNRENVGDTTADDAYEAEQWRSYLVGGLRAGGRGIYVLDVTNPDSTSGTITHPRLSDAESVANRIVVNEFTHPSLGHIYGTPRIGKMNNGRWAAIVGNGYNSSANGDGTASLFIIYLDRSTEGSDPTDSDNDGIYNNGFGDYSIITAKQNSWIQCAVEDDTCTLPETAQVRYGADTTDNGVSDGTYTTPVTMTGSFQCDNATFGNPLVGVSKVCEYSDNNGLSQPSTIDVDGDGIIDRIYAGDLHGNMWIFDVSTVGTSAGTDAHTNGASQWGVHANAEEPFFTACSAALNEHGACPRESRQPITSTPLITNNPVQIDDATAPNHLVFFGTGQYVTDEDESNTDIQTFYGIWDAGTSSSGLTQSNLTARVINPVDDNGNRTIASGTVNYSVSESDFGWYFQSLPESRERVVLNPLLFGDTLLFQTLIPIRGTCNATAGSGFIMAVDPLTGGNPSFDILGQADGINVAGSRISSVIVGSSITRTADDTKLNVRTADGQITEISVARDLSDLNNTTAGELFNRRGRKSWSILQ